jgi:iron complex transport system substrate-binding protein
VKPRWSWLLLGLGLCAIAGAGVVSARGGAEPAAKPRGERLVLVGGAITEIVFALGAGDRVVGVDTSSYYPAETAELAKVGYQRILSAEGVLSLAPTKLIVSPEAGPPAVLEALAAAGVEIVRVDAPFTLEGARERVLRVAAALGVSPDALLAKMREDEAEARRVVAAGCGKPKVLFVYARGLGSPMVSGDKTAASAMIELAGGQNAVTGFDSFKPLTAEAALAAAPDAVLLPARAFESLGGARGVFEMPGLALTPAGHAQRVARVDDLQLLGFGPRAGLAVQELSRQLRPCLPSDPAKRDGGER